MAGGVELATAYVSLVVEGSKVSPGVKKALDGTETEASRAGDRAGKSYAKKFGGALKIGATLAAGFAAVKGVQFLGDAIEEAREAQVVTARTANVIKSMGNVAGVTAKEVADLAGAISNKVGIDDEAIQSGQNMLLTFGKIRDEVGKGNDIFTQTTGLMVDMSVAMGQDMQSSAVQLGKALNDPIKGVTALSRVGVSFTEQQKKQIKALTESGDAMAAQKIILREVKKQFGGAAEAMSTPADRARVAWGNLKEQIGTELLPVVDRVSTWLAEEGIPKVSKFFDEIRKGKGFGGDVAEAFRDVKGAISDALPMAKKFIGYFADMPGWAQKLLVGGAAAAIVIPKVPKVPGLGGAVNKLVGGGVQKVFVTNPGFGKPGGPGGIPVAGGTPKGGAPAGGGSKLGMWAGIVGPLGLAIGLAINDRNKERPKGGLSPSIGGGAITDWRKQNDEAKGYNGTIKLLASTMSDFNAAAKLAGLAGSGLDREMADLAKRNPAKALQLFNKTAQKSGVSVEQLARALPKTSKQLDQAGVKTGGWSDRLKGLRGDIEKVDSKKPNVPFKFPGMDEGRSKIPKLGGDIDKVGRKKPTPKFSFPGLIAGINDGLRLDRVLDEAAKDRTATVHTRYTYEGRGPRPYDATGTSGGRHAGGGIAPRQTYIVGERGPELFTSQYAGRITPAHAIDRATGGSGDNITIYGTDPKAVVREMQARKRDAFALSRLTA